MKITYSGTNGELSPREQSKIDQKFAKLSKLVEKRGEKGAHVIATKTRHLQKAEVTMNLRDRALVAIGSDGSLFNALSAAIENLEKQALKMQTRSRDTKRSSKVTPAAPVPEVEQEAPTPRIMKVTAHQRRKPMTLEEAVLEMGNRTHYVFRGEDSRTTVIVRRTDGHIDLIEG